MFDVAILRLQKDRLIQFLELNLEFGLLGVMHLLIDLGHLLALELLIIILFITAIFVRIAPSKEITNGTMALHPLFQGLGLQREDTFNATSHHHRL